MITMITNVGRPRKTSVTMAPNVGHEAGAGSLVISYPNKLVTPATAYCTATERVESDNSGDSYGKPHTTTAKESRVRRIRARTGRSPEEVSD